VAESANIKPRHFKRYGTGEFVSFLSRASGSLAGLETQALLSADLNFCKSSDIEAITGETG
jgi:hypothetical protein